MTLLEWYFLFIYFFLKKNHYAPVSQANWCNMTFTAANLFPVHSCFGWPKSSPHWDSNPGPQHERRWLTNWANPPPLNDDIIVWNIQSDDAKYVIVPFLVVPLYVPSGRLLAMTSETSLQLGAQPRPQSAISNKQSQSDIDQIV